MSPDSDIIEMLRQVAVGAADDLGRAFHCYYPVEGNNDISESITTTYLAFQLRDLGFFVFPQIQCSERIDNHLDFSAIDPARRLVLLGEVKRLYNSQKARELGADWLRLRGARIASDLREIPTDYRTVYCLAATTWSEPFRTWWEAQPRTPVPGRQRNSADWANLKSALDSADCNYAVQVSLDRLDWSDNLYLLISIGLARAAGEAAGVAGPAKQGSRRRDTS